ncbi:hypothetical protein HDE_01148 [Halotydeus destructor]|nr:hypothetical protein HDE_01148 [Halotydeus destructor]
MNTSICIVVAILSAILVVADSAADPCFAGMTDAGWLKAKECSKKLNVSTPLSHLSQGPSLQPDFEAKQKKWISCFTEVNKVEKVPATFDEIKAIACGDANKANKDKVSVATWLW